MDVSRDNPDNMDAQHKPCIQISVSIISRQDVLLSPLRVSVLPFPLSFHVSHKGMVVFSNVFCPGVPWPPLPFIYRKGSL